MISHRKHGSHHALSTNNQQNRLKTPKKSNIISSQQKSIIHQDWQTHNEFSQGRMGKTPQRHTSRGVRHPSTPFVSVYGRQTRLDQIMKIKVKPAIDSTRQYHLEIDERQKQQDCKQQKTRLDKIMAIKVKKPNISSTLINYHPKNIKPSHNPEEKNPSPEEQTLFQAQIKYKKMLELQEREDKKWRNEEKQRQDDLRAKLRKEQKENSDKRRKQILFENMVQKQMKKLQRQRELSERRNGGFAIYVYSCY